MKTSVARALGPAQTKVSVGASLNKNPFSLKGTETNPVGRTVVSIKNPEFQPGTGDILYEENIVNVQRTDGQAESLKFVIRF